MNSFLSTTLDHEVAVIFSGDTGTSNDEFQPALFEIEADLRIVSVKPFANIISFSYMANEEVLMSHFI